MSLPVENDASRRWLQAHPLRRTITLRQTDRISSPLTFGLLHPVILMPKETDWDDEASLQFVLEHEFVQEAETNELINKVYDGSADKLFAALLSRKKLSAEQIERLKQIVGELE